MTRERAMRPPRISLRVDLADRLASIAARYRMRSMQDALAVLLAAWDIEHPEPEEDSPEPAPDEPDDPT